METPSATLSFRRYVKKNKPREVRCAGKGVTKAYLHEKLSALGLLDGPGAPASATSHASYSVREKIIKTYPALAGGRNASASTKRAMTEVAKAFANTPAWKITEYCNIKDFCEDSFFEALFHDVYPDIHELFSKVPVSTEMKSFHDEYRPESLDKQKNNKRHYNAARPRVYRDRLSVEDVLNDHHVESKDSAFFQSYPFLSVYRKTLPLFVEYVIVANDMDLYRYLDVPLTGIERHLLSGKPNIVSIVLSDGRVDPAARDNEAIREASEHDKAEVVRLQSCDSPSLYVRRGGGCGASSQGPKSRSRRRGQLCDSYGLYVRPCGGCGASSRGRTRRSRNREK